MTAYKLVRKRKNGTLAPLFINARMTLPIGVPLKSECHPTNGFAVRQGWHCTAKPVAPHLSPKGRVWVEVEIEDYTEFRRPESQGGLWFLADRMTVVRELNNSR